MRPESKPREDFFQGAKVVIADVCDEDNLKSVIPGPVDAVISCLASRSGVKEDSYKIDYQATLNSLNAAKAAGASNFVLLSAYCVRKPLLQFQNAKLKVIESELFHSSARKPNQPTLHETFFLTPS